MTKLREVQQKIELRLLTKPFSSLTVYSDFTTSIPTTQVGREDSKQSGVLLAKMQSLYH